MLFSDFLILTGIEPSQKEIRENFKADLRKSYLRSAFLIHKIVYKLCKTVLSDITN